VSVLDDWQAYRAMLKLVKQYQSHNIRLEVLVDSLEAVGVRETTDPGTYFDWSNCILEVLREDAGLPPLGAPRGHV
jgi:hypothetical protein